MNYSELWERDSSLNKIPVIRYNSCNKIQLTLSLSSHHSLFAYPGSLILLCAVSDV